MTDPRDTDPLYVPEDEHAERRDARRLRRKVLDNRRSVFLMDRLSREPARRKQKRGAKHG